MPDDVDRCGFRGSETSSSTARNWPEPVRTSGRSRTPSGSARSRRERHAPVHRQVRPGSPQGRDRLQRALLAQINADRPLRSYRRRRVRADARYTFDPAVLEFMRPALLGAPLITFAPGYQIRDHRRSPTSSATHRVTAAMIAPVMLAAMIETLSSLEWSATLAKVSTGGEAVPPAVAAAVASGMAVGRAALISTGPPRPPSTRRSTTTTRQPAGSPSSANRRRYRACVLDDRLGLVPDGVAGELYLGGDPGGAWIWLADRDHRRTFRRRSFGPAGSRLYRTGDTVPVVGWIVEYLRKDFQIKLRSSGSN